MFNLLPESLKETIITEYKLRRVILILVFIFCLEISFGIFLLPSWILSYSREKEAEVRSEKLNSSPITTTLNSIKPVIRAINNDLTSIDKSLDYLRVMPILDFVISKKGSSIHLIQFAYVSNSANSAMISINGFSDTRDSLVKFKKDLEEGEMIKSVDLPISNYAKDKNIEFTMTIVAAPKQ